MFGARRDLDWQADRVRGGSRQGLWALWVHRFGRRVDALPKGLYKSILLRYYALLFLLVEMSTGISIPKECVIGKGLRIFHFGGIIVNTHSRIGENCTLRHGVTIGNRRGERVAPVLGNNVEVGAYAQVLGDIRIGNGSKIGALAVVLADMPDGLDSRGYGCAHH